MSMSTMPAKVDVYYKLRHERMQDILLGMSFTDSSTDSDSGTAGVQNQGSFFVDFDPRTEIYDLFYRSVNQSGEGKSIGLRRTLIRHNLRGSLNSTALTFTVDPPDSSTTFRIGDPIQIEDEIMIVSAVTFLDPTTLGVEARGVHGTDAAAHADDVSVALLRYTVPHNTITLVGNIDTLKPLIPSKLVLTDTIGSLGNGIDFEIHLPVAQIKTLRKFQLQLSTAAFVADLAGTTGLKDIRANASDGAITQGGQTLTTATSLSGYAGKIIYTHEGINIATGEVDVGLAFEIASVSTSGSNHIATIAGDNKFRLKSGAEGVSGTVNWIVADGWSVPGNTSTLVANEVKDVAYSSGFPGDPTVMNTQHATLHTAATVYARVRVWNYNGTGPWRYWDRSTGTATIGSQNTHVPEKQEILGTAPSGLFRTATSGARLEINATDGLIAVDSNGHNRVQIDTDGDLIAFKDTAGNAAASLYGYPTNTFVIAPTSNADKNMYVGYVGKDFHTTWINATRNLYLYAQDAGENSDTGWSIYGEAGNESVIGFVDDNRFMATGASLTTFFYGDVVPSGTQDLGLTGTRWNNLWCSSIICTNVVAMDESSQPDAQADRALIYAKENSGATELRVRFPDGTDRLIATE